MQQVKGKATSIKEYDFPNRAFYNVLLVVIIICRFHQSPNAKCG